jgi:hypothetical protein
LKEALAGKSKRCEDLEIRCEIMALWAGKGKTLARLSILKLKSYLGLKKYWQQKKHNKLLMVHKLRKYRETIKRSVFLGWEKQYKVWKLKKNKEDFEK